MGKERARGNMKKKGYNATQCSACLHQCNEECPAFNVCAKRILIVGGITKLKAHYRKLVEKKGAIFEYHDGYMNGGTRGLEGRVRRSDVVLCPVSCNSHMACLCLKRLCLKHKKPVRMISSASLSAISKALIGQQPVLN